MADIAQFKAEITVLFTHHGGDLYGGEDIDQTAHALQCAQLAEEVSAPPRMILAALLHDIGHLLHDDFEQTAKGNTDRLHEELGYAFLKSCLGEGVAEPVRLHVAAKRYLCATKPVYLGQLSAASKHSLKLQGGPMDKAEIAAFEQNRFYRDAVKLRYWDDLGKDPAMTTKSLAHFLSYVDKL